VSLVRGGLPSAGDVHEVAQAIATDSRVVHVDHDPIVNVHANALQRDIVKCVKRRAVYPLIR
jgi:hypothetical protein